MNYFGKGMKHQEGCNNNEFKYGIMNNIIRKASIDSNKYRNLRWILECLGVKDDIQYRKVRDDFEKITQETRKKRRPFAQLDFRFRDHDGIPIEDYSFVLGVIVNGRKRPSNTVAHLHKNTISKNHISIFLNIHELEPNLTYFFDLTANTDTPLVEYDDRWTPERTGNQLTSIISQDQTTQIDVKLSREPNRELFIFHTGDDKDLHVKWDRSGIVTKKRLKTK